MIRKIFLTILTMILSINAYANIHIDGKTAGRIIREHIDANYKELATEEYNTQLKATGNYTMSVSGLYKVCAAAGWDIATTGGKTKCDNFVQALVEASDYKYYEICGKDKGKSGGTEHCIDNVFYSLIGGTQVTKLQADGLCKEYAHVKYNDDIECSTDTRKGTINPLNDYVKCTSKLNPVYYEFKFDDITESVDFTIQQSVQESLCKIYGLKFQKSIGTPDANGNLNMTTPYCETKDTNLCKKISESAERFNMYAEIRTGNFYGSGYCGLYQTNKIYSQRDLKTAYGIANDVFYNNLIQIQGSKDLTEGIKQYIADKIKPEQIIKFKCNDNAIQIGSIRGKSDNDDVLTCYVNDNQIDFVFDDLSEAMKLYRMAGQEAFSCVVNGGTYTGKRCVNLNEEQCKKIAQSTFLTEDCPECKTAYWDGNICTLPNASVANALQKGLNISLIVGGAVLNVVITVQTGGTNTAVGGGLLFVETVGSAIELGTEIRMDLAADKFFVESAQCKDKNCAKNLIGKHLQRLSNFYNRLTDAEEKAIDHEMARLFELIPAEELISVDALVKVDQENGGKKLASVKENQKGFFDSKSWEPEQIWQAVGITLQMTSLFYSIGNWVYGKTHKATKVMTEVANVLDNKTDDALKRLREKGLNVEVDKNGTIHFLDKLETDIMSSYTDYFKTRYLYDLDLPATTYEEVLRKWNLPVDATDEMIEARYKELSYGVNPFGNGEANREARNNHHEATNVFRKINSDYDVIKQTKTNYLKKTSTDLMGNPSLYNSMLDELANTTGYNAFISKGADDFELLAEKFGIEQYFGSYKPRNVDEATQILHRIQDQLDETEQVLNKYVDNLGETDDYLLSRKIFEQDKDVAEDYIRYLDDYVKRGGFGIEGVVSELSERAGYEAMELTPERRFGIIQEFGEEHPYYREDAIARLHKVEEVLNNTHMILSKHYDNFRNVDDWDRLLYKFKEDKEWAENYMWYLKGFIEIADSL